MIYLKINLAYVIFSNLKPYIFVTDSGLRKEIFVTNSKLITHHLFIRINHHLVHIFFINGHCAFPKIGIGWVKILCLGCPT